MISFDNSSATNQPVSSSSSSHNKIHPTIHYEHSYYSYPHITTANSGKNPVVNCNGIQHEDRPGINAQLKHCKEEPIKLPKRKDHKANASIDLMDDDEPTVSFKCKYCGEYVVIKSSKFKKLKEAGRKKGLFKASKSGGVTSVCHETNAYSVNYGNNTMKTTKMVETPFSPFANKNGSYLNTNKSCDYSPPGMLYSCISACSW